MLTSVDSPEHLISHRIPNKDHRCTRLALICQSYHEYFACYEFILSCMSFPPENPQSNSSQNPTILTGSSSDLLWCTLSTLLALNSSSLSLGTGSSGLSLLGLLCALGGSALVLTLLDCGLAGGGTSLWSLGSSLLDDVEGSTNDGTLGLDGTAGTLLGNLLYTRKKNMSVLHVPCNPPP